MNSIFVMVIVIGIPGAIWPYKFALLGEQIDAFGSKRSSSEVEPADWYVEFTRDTGIVCILIGLGGLLIF